ncbi:hypothetical protein V498_06370, partial [Pseudogymnoascus sp. VKM F-4517 (FW-2822)]
KRKAMPDFEELHDLARHARHLVEIETVAIETMERVTLQQSVNFDLLRTGLDKTYQIQAGEYMAFQLQMMKSLRSRAQATLDRLNGEVTLAYNTLASMDNRIMKSITILAMVFIPATFVAGLFSTTFFSYAENDGWGFSSKFWVYWVVVIPLTAAIISGWWLWLGMSSSKSKPSQVSEPKTLAQTGGAASFIVGNAPTVRAVEGIERELPTANVSELLADYHYDRASDSEHQQYLEVVTKLKYQI